MFRRFFSTRGRYRLYSICVAVGLSIYLFGGFVLVKLLFAAAPFIPSAIQIAGVAIGAILFALIHRASMSDFDSTR